MKTATLDLDWSLSIVSTTMGKFSFFPFHVEHCYFLSKNENGESETVIQRRERETRQKQNSNCYGNLLFTRAFTFITYSCENNFDEILENFRFFCFDSGVDFFFSSKNQRGYRVVKSFIDNRRKRSCNSYQNRDLVTKIILLGFFFQKLLTLFIKMN